MKPRTIRRSEGAAPLCSKVCRFVSGPSMRNFLLCGVLIMLTWHYTTLQSCSLAGQTVDYPSLASLPLYTDKVQSREMQSSGKATEVKIAKTDAGEKKESSKSKGGPPYPYYRPFQQVDDDNNTIDGIQARAFLPWPKDVPLPCEPAETNWTSSNVQYSTTTTGLIFASMYKTASTTASGVHIRMSLNIAKDIVAKNDEYSSNFVSRMKTATPVCKTRYMHMRVYSRAPARNKKKSFLWTLIRDPTKRVISQYFYNLGNAGVPSDENVKKSILKNRTSDSDFVNNHYLYRLSTLDPAKLYGKKLTSDTIDHDINKRLVENIIAEYDFIGITERIDESLTVMATLLDIPVTHVMYLKSNKANGQFSRGSRSEKCNYLIPSFVTDGVKEFFATDQTWQDRVYWDHLIYEVANRSLDMTIAKLGEAYEKNWQMFQQVAKRSNEVCLPKTVFPCSAGGDFRNDTDCLFLDSGCGNTCLDEVSREFI